MQRSSEMFFNDLLFIIFVRKAKKHPVLCGSTIKTSQCSRYGQGTVLIFVFIYYAGGDDTSVSSH